MQDYCSDPADQGNIASSGQCLQPKVQLPGTGKHDVLLLYQALYRNYPTTAIFMHSEIRSNILSLKLVSQQIS